ncbi:MAG TPA: hypothetical protein VJM12_07425 [Pyrinomonadaceae bacterium]|nr:hypothetical protein [Pyrinomonadaceae bacterium]
MASIQLHPEIVQRNGKSVVVLPYEEFVVLQEILADYEDLLDLRAAKHNEHDAPSVPLSEVQREFGT